MILRLQPGDSLRIFDNNKFIGALCSTKESIYIDIHKTYPNSTCLTFSNNDIQSNGLVFSLFGDKAIAYNQNKQVAYIDLDNFKEND